MIGGLLSALFGLGLLLAGARMVLRPNAYIGAGYPPAQDPRTVRFFGTVFALLGGAIFVLVLIQFVQE